MPPRPASRSRRYRSAMTVPTSWALTLPGYLRIPSPTSLTCPKGQTSRPVRAVVESLAGPCAGTDGQDVDAHARGRHAAGPPGPVPTPAREPVRAQPALPPVPGYDATAAAALLRLQREYGNARVPRLVAVNPPATSALIVEDAVTELAEG